MRLENNFLISLPAIPNRVILWIVGIFAGIFIHSCVPTPAHQNETTPPSINISDSSVRPSVLLSEGLSRIQLDYVDPQRLIPYNMLKGALSELELSIPEIQTSLIEKGTQHSLTIYVGTNAHTFNTGKIRDLYELHNVLQTLIAYLRKKHEDIPLFDIEAALLQGLLKELDPHSVFLPPEVYHEFQINTGGRFAGVGMMVGIQNHTLTVITPIDGSPAAKAGILPNDHIVRIGDEDTSNMTLADTVSKLRGTVGSRITIYIMRKGFTKPKKIELVREVIKISSIETVNISPSETIIQYIKIKHFQEDTSQELDNAIKSPDEIKGIILDLRNNPGGLLDQAIKVSDLFLPPNKTIVSTVSNQKKAQTHQSTWFLKDESLLAIPLVVLVNGGSASASEIVAAALKTHNRAVIIGEQTFGKGSVQTVRELKDKSALKLTIAKYLTPGNRSIQSVGVTPHILLFPAVIRKEKFHLSKMNYRSQEKDLFQNFQEWGQSPETPDAKLQYLLPNDPSSTDEQVVYKKPDEKKLNDDFYTKLAIQILVEHHKSNVGSILKTALKTQKKVNAEQEKKLVDALNQLGIDWANAPSDNGTRSDQLTSDIYIKRQASTNEWKKSSDPVPPNTKIQLCVSVKNRGTLPIHRLLAISKSPAPIFDNLEFPLGYIPPGASRLWTLPVVLPSSHIGSLEPIGFEFINDRLQTLHTSKSFIRFHPVPQPEFQFELAIFDDGQQNSIGNGDKIPQSGETVAIEISLSNTGRASSEKTVVLLKKGRNTIAVQKSRQVLGKMDIGAQQKATYLLNIPDSFSQLNSPLTLEIFDTRFRKFAQKYKLFLDKRLREKTYKPPRIYLQTTDKTGALLPQVTFEDEVIIQGRVEDDEQAKDIFIFLNDRKVFFKPNQQKPLAPTLSFKKEFLLKEGYNRFILFARDQNNLLTRKEVRLWKLTSDN